MTDKEQMSRGDALAKVAALEAELADLRGRVSVPSDRDALLYLMERFDSEESNCPVCGHSEATSNMDSANYLREYLAAATAPVDRNQCDGCQAGIPAENGMHRMGKPGGYPDLMACTADRYGSAPVDRVEQESVTTESLDLRRAYEVADKHWMLQACPKDVFRFALIAALQGNKLYTTPQPAPTAAQDVVGLVEALQLFVRWVDMEQSENVTAGVFDRLKAFRNAETKARAVLAAHQSGGAK